MRMTSAYNRLAEMSKRYRIAQGGTSAGKTWAILQYLIAFAEQRENKVISVVSSTLPALRLGAMRDFAEILKATNHYIYFEQNRTTNSWVCKATGSTIEFVGLEDELKARGSRRDVLFVNEANRLKYETFTQLAVRTSGFIFIDYNPSARFWVHDHLQDRSDADFGIFTYLDNEELSQSIIDDIESRDKGSNWWRVYGQGLVGELEGNIFKGWEWVDERPTSELVAYGLDFGFKPDPAALVALYKTDGGYFAQELWTKYGLTPSAIVEAVAVSVEAGIPIIADNARPEIIAEMAEAGLSVLPCVKQESVNGVKVGKLGQLELMQEVKFSAMGKTLEREYLTYAYATSKDGAFTAKVPDGDDHLIDALRYAWYWHFRSDRINKEIESALKEYA